MRCLAVTLFLYLRSAILKWYTYVVLTHKRMPFLLRVVRWLLPITAVVSILTYSYALFSLVQNFVKNADPITHSGLPLFSFVQLVVLYVLGLILAGIQILAAIEMHNPRQYTRPLVVFAIVGSYFSVSAGVWNFLLLTQKSALLEVSLWGVGLVYVALNIGALLYAAFLFFAVFEKESHHWLKKGRTHA